MTVRKHGDENGMCVLDETLKCDNCGECDRCDLDPSKICDNCGACLNEYNTNEKGFVEIPIDKIDTSGASPSETSSLTTPILMPFISLFKDFR